ncbi:hypothetical protein [Embleya sp. NPDC001921]
MYPCPLSASLPGEQYSSGRAGDVRRFADNGTVPSGEVGIRPTQWGRSRARIRPVDRMETAVTSDKVDMDDESARLLRGE